MTTVIGFNWPPIHDNTVAVIVDGKLIFASEEERYTRHKHSIEEPPFNALRQAFIYLKNRLGVKPADIDAFAVNFDPSYMALNARILFTLRASINILRSRYNIPLPRFKTPSHIIIGDYLFLQGYS